MHGCPTCQAVKGQAEAFVLFGAASIYVRLLFEGGHYKHAMS